MLAFSGCGASEPDGCKIRGNRLECAGYFIVSSGSVVRDQATLEAGRLYAVVPDDDSDDVFFLHSDDRIAVLSEAASQRAVAQRLAELASGRAVLGIRPLTLGGRTLGVDIRQTASGASFTYELENLMRRRVAIQASSGGETEWTRMLAPTEQTGVPEWVEWLTDTGKTLSEALLPGESLDRPLYTRELDAASLTDYAIDLYGGYTRLAAFPAVQLAQLQARRDELQAAQSRNAGLFALVQAIDAVDWTLPLMMDVVGLVPGGGCTGGTAATFAESLQDAVMPLLLSWVQDEALGVVLPADAGVDRARAVAQDLVKSLLEHATQVIVETTLQCAPELSIDALKLAAVLPYLLKTAKVVIDAGDFVRGAHESWTAGVFGSVVLPLGIQDGTTLAAGHIHNCVLTADGTLSCWGEGVVTDCTPWDPSCGEATPPDGTFLEVDAGLRHTCGLSTAGAINCFGMGTVGSGQNEDYGQAIPPAGTFVRLAVGGYSTCGLSAAGEVSCTGVAEIADYVPTAPFARLSVGNGYACGIHADDGSLECWGNGIETCTCDETEYGIFGPPPGGSFVEVEVGYEHACAITLDGELECWGHNNAGQATPPSFEGRVTKVAVGYWHTCAIEETGHLTCWGYDYYGQAASPEGQFLDVGCGQYHSCGVHADGSVECWGHDGFGQSTPPG